LDRPRPLSSDPKFDSTGSSSLASVRHSPAKRPRRGVRRIDFGDGDIIYLSTDDEDVDERPATSVNKKPKLGGALIKSENGASRDFF